MNKIRCAIYTRKSSEEGLEQDFNSLDAQREACRAYIESQKHEGWMLLPDLYDDGGISGGTLERVGLQRLLQDVDEGRIDQIVVYKIDRLTRSLSDFARLVDRLEKANASFVSVTQSFNTATSMGRLTLNVLLSFAQFEREVTAERIRDKITASKKRGLWMGGTVPLGYEPDGRSLRIVEEEAKTVKTIFDLYLTHGSLMAVKREADRLQLKTKARYLGRRRAGGRNEAAKAREQVEGQEQTATGSSPPPPLGGASFERSHIHYLLKNPLYAGFIRHKNKVHEGLHPAIIAREVWQEVQSRLQKETDSRRSQRPAAPLTGKLFDETGDRLTPTHCTRRGKRYRYYQSSRTLTGKSQGKQSHSTSPPATDRTVWRLPAPELETKLARGIVDYLTAVGPARLLVGASLSETEQFSIWLRTLQQQSEDDPSAILHLLEKAVVEPGRIRVELSGNAMCEQAEIGNASRSPEQLVFTIPFRMRRRGIEAKLMIGDNPAPVPDLILIRNLALAHSYYKAITEGQSVEDLASAEGTSKRRIQQLLQFAFLAPDLVERVVCGEQPDRLTSKWLEQNPLPSCWQEQREIVARL